MARFRCSGSRSGWRPWAISLVVAALVAASAVAHQIYGNQRQPDGPQLVLVQTAGTTEEADLQLPSEVVELVTGTAEANGRLTWLRADGDGRTQAREIDLTPRTANGEEVKPTRARKQRIAEDQVELLTEMNAFDSSGGRDVMGALQAVPSGGAWPVIVMSSMLSTEDPLRIEGLAFDSSVADVVDHLGAIGEIPQGLEGRAVWLVFTPVAGAQQPLRRPQRDYLIELYRGVIEAGGGELAHVLDGAEAPAGGGGSAPLTTVPPAPETFVPVRDEVPVADASGQEKNPPLSRVQCILPTPVLFEADKDVLLDAEAAKMAVTTCLGDDPARIVSLELTGHTAMTVNRPDNSIAIELSRSRAQRVADVCVALGIDPGVVAVRGVGATEQLFDPASDPRNRAVQLLVTYER